jgi:hypothetical protein
VPVSRQARILLVDDQAELLEAVEETVTVLRRLPVVSQDAEAAEVAARLAGRVGRLRDALDALGAGRR